MCEEHHDAPRPDGWGRVVQSPGGMGRRRLLQAIGGGVAGAMFAAVPLASVPFGARPARALTGEAPWTPVPAMRGAMHLHGSHSEGTGSVGAHIAELDRTGFDFAFMTDHDWRKRAIGAFTDVPLDRFEVGNDAGGRWLWQPQELGQADVRRADIFSTDSSGDATSTADVFRVVVKAAGEEEASHLLFANTSGNRDANRVNLTGQQIRLTLRPRIVGQSGHLLLRLALSYHPASGGGEPGHHYLDYRFGVRDGHEQETAHHGVVWRSVDRHDWQQVVLDPVSDIAMIWPDMVAEDNSLNGLWLGATASGSRKAVGEFAHLGISHGAQAGHEPTEATRAIIEAQLAARGSGLAMYAAEEVSLGGLHANQFGPTLVVPEYPVGVDHLDNLPTPSQMRTLIAEQLRPSGNLVSLNHVFGTSEGGALPAADQRALCHEVALELMAADLFGVDIVEFGYTRRGRVELDEHLHLMEILLRNGYVVTASGVSDDHGARENSIHKINNPMATSLWSPTTDLADLMTATAEGRGFISNIGRFSGLLDLQVDTFTAGSVVVDSRVDRPRDKTLLVHGSDLRDGHVEVVQGPVEEIADGWSPLLDPASVVLATIDMADLNRGSVPVPIDVSGSTYVYLRGYTRTPRGQVFLTAFTNPVWWLAHDPVPSTRVAPSRTVTYV